MPLIIGGGRQGQPLPSSTPASPSSNPFAQGQSAVSNASGATQTNFDFNGQWRHDDHVDNANDVMEYRQENISIQPSERGGSKMVIDINRIAQKNVTTPMGDGGSTNRTVNYSSGRAVMPLGVSQGRIDVTAKLPQGSGLHPTLWLLPEDGTWPPEIDIAEGIGQTSASNGSFRTNFITGTHTNANYDNGKDIQINDPTGWHQYSVDIRNNQITWLVDNQAVRSAQLPPNYSKKWNLVVSGAVGPAFQGIGNPNFQNAKIEVADVKVSP